MTAIYQPDNEQPGTADLDDWFDYVCDLANHTDRIVTARTASGAPVPTELKAHECDVFHRTDHIDTLIKLDNGANDPRVLALAKAFAIDAAYDAAHVENMLRTAL